VARPSVHPPDTILDAARSLALDGGTGSATVAEIASASGAPVGSIYHRFGSRDELLARLWIRAVHRSQASFLAAIDQTDPVEAAVACATAIVEFCEAEPADARLLVAFRREDLIRAPLPAELTAELEELNKPLQRAIARLARKLHGSAGRAAVERTLFAVFDLPYGAARRHLVAGKPLPGGLRDDVEKAVRAVLA
jgi:AcrR family transcriptional regulator